MDAGDGSVERSWSELPGDLLGAVYRGCSSAHDRMRFAAVCASWRAAASWHLPLSALPLLLPSPSACREAVRAYSPEDGRPLRLPLPSTMTPGTRLVGTHDGGWIAATRTSDDHRHQLMIVNLFSGVEVALSPKQRVIECACPHAPERFDAYFNPTTDRPAIKKVIFSGDPSSSGCILAATTGICNLAFCSVASPDAGWTTLGCGIGRYTWRYGEFVDISFCNGELDGLSGNSKLLLYGISRTENKLLMFEVSVNEDGGAPVIVDAHVISDLKTGIPCTPEGTWHTQHIFELGGKVAVVVERTNVHGEASYLVYELVGDKMRRRKNRWVEVTSFEDHALFLSPGCSKAVHVSANGTRGGVYRNCIYYPKRHLQPFEGERYMKRLDMGGCIVYSWDNEYVHHLGRIMSQVYHYRCKDRANGFIWFLPPDF